MKILHHPDKADIHLSSVLYALSDPIRLRIINVIHHKGESICGEIGVPVAKSTMSHHTRTLREAGVIRVRMHGTQHFLSLRSDDLKDRFPGLLEAILEAYTTDNLSEDII